VTAALLEIGDLTLAADGRTLVDALGLSVAAGEIVAVVGESGSGKTLSSLATLGLLPPGVGITGGSIRFAGEELVGAPEARLRRLRGAAIGMIFQDPMTSLNPAMTIGAQLDEGLRTAGGPDRAARRAAILAMLARIAIADPARALAAYPHEFSGGMRQRIMIASAMLRRPRLLIADEPTTALDTLSQREVMDLMTALAAEEGAAMLLITHDLALVGRYATRVAVMEKGRLVETGDAAAVLAYPQQPYTRTLLASLPTRGVPRPMPAAAPILAVEGLTVRYRRRGQADAFAAVDDVSFTLAAGETLAVVGGSGSGKTTLGRAVLGLVRPDAGRIAFAGSDPAVERGTAQLVFQDPFSSLDPRMPVRDIVAEPLRRDRRLNRQDRAARVDAMLAAVGLADFATRRPHRLSGGQRQRVAIARALVTRPRLVVADEPVSALDVTIQRQVLDLFDALRRDHGFACLFVSHDLGVVAQIADRVLVMRDGRVVEQGPCAAIFDAPRHDFTRAMLAATPVLARPGNDRPEQGERR